MLCLGSCCGLLVMEEASFGNAQDLVQGTFIPLQLGRPKMVGHDYFAPAGGCGMTPPGSGRSALNLAHEAFVLDLISTASFWF
jgi:hypothetical protein